MVDVNALRDSAYNECLEMLRTKRTCALVRPTGFGKTGLLTRFIKDFKNVVYIYPSEIIRDAVLLFYYGSPDSVPKSRTIQNVTFLSYMALACIDVLDSRDRKKLNKIANSDLIIFDECHRIGAQGASKTLDIILEINPDVRMIGATATPERSDLIDEIARYFGNNFISEYNLHNAFQDGVLKKPYYFYCNQKKIQRDLNKELSLAQKEINLAKDASETEGFQHLNERLVEISNLYEMPTIVKTLCDEYVSDTSYMRFICFCSSYERMRLNEDKVKGWFEQSYPDHKVRVMKISAEDELSKSNALKLKHLKVIPGRIDIIMSCNMLNMGYHVDSLTGIIMLRGTKSGIIYTQQLGRVLSSGDNQSKLCIDVVDNIHVQSQYTLFGKISDHAEFIKARRAELKQKKAIHDLANELLSGVHYTYDEIVCKYPLVPEETVSNLMKETCDQLKNHTWSLGDEQELSNLCKKLRDVPAHRHNQKMHPEDLICIRYEATYRELIRKTVAEARSMRARQAWARWLEQGGTYTDDNGVPLTRLQILKLVPPDNIPLPPFCYAKQVSVDAVLDEMGVV